MLPTPEETEPEDIKVEGSEILPDSFKEEIEDNDLIPDHIFRNMFIFSMREQEIRAYFTQLIGKEKIWASGTNYLAFKGDIPIGLVAHYDTISLHRENSKKDKESFPPKIFLREGGPDLVLEAPTTGMGADDRAGCMMIAALLDLGYRPWVFLTDFEERGLVGAGEMVEGTKGMPKPEINLLIQIDRKDRKDCVFYEYNIYGTEGAQFVKMIESYGFTKEIGTSSDIKRLAPAYGVAATNISAGYQREHTLFETLNMTWWWEILNKVKKMLDDVTAGTGEISKKWPWIERYSVPTHDYNTYGNNNWNRAQENRTKIYDQKKASTHCVFCGKYVYSGGVKLCLPGCTEKTKLHLKDEGCFNAHSACYEAMLFMFAADCQLIDLPEKPGDKKKKKKKERATNHPPTGTQTLIIQPVRGVPNSLVIKERGIAGAGLGVGMVSASARLNLKEPDLKKISEETGISFELVKKLADSLIEDEDDAAKVAKAMQDLSHEQYYDNEGFWY